MGRFSQAISEGDGISVIPSLRGDVGRLSPLAADAGAEAIAVWSTGDAEIARSQTGLPVLLRAPAFDGSRGVESLERPDADACVLVYEHWRDFDGLEDLHGWLVEEDVDCVVDVRDEDELEEALERLDPEIVLLSERDRDRDEADLERTLDLLPGVPAGKLVVSEARVISRDQALALERAGVDAVLVPAVPEGADFTRTLADLVGGARPGA